MQGIKLTIITINLNNLIGLKSTFDSVKKLPENTEWIVIDGCSVDGSKEFIENNSLVNFYISEKDTGIYNAMNKGVTYSSGDWIIFMNSGDEFTFNSINDILYRIENMDDDYDLFYGQNFSKKNEILIDKVISKNWNWSLYALYKGCLPHQSTVTRRNLLIKFPFHEQYKVASTRIFFIETIVVNKIKYLYIPVPYSICDIEGVSNFNRELLMFELSDYIKHVFGNSFLMDCKYFDDLERVVNNRTLFELIKKTSNRPRIKMVIDNLASIILKII